MKIDQVTQKIINELFEILRNVHDSHWKAPMAADVINKLNADDVYEFKAGSIEKHMWTCRLTITKTFEGDLLFAYHLNQDLPTTMRVKQASMKKEFDKRFTAYCMTKKQL